MPSGGQPPDGITFPNSFQSSIADIFLYHGARWAVTHIYFLEVVHFQVLISGTFWPPADKSIPWHVFFRTKMLVDRTALLEWQLFRI